MVKLIRLIITFYDCLMQWYHSFFENLQQINKCISNKKALGEKLIKDHLFLKRLEFKYLWYRYEKRQEKQIFYENKIKYITVLNLISYNSMIWTIFVLFLI
jgi:hypothetical protein